MPVVEEDSRKKKILWSSLTFIYILFIYATLGIMPHIRTILTSVFGDSIYNSVIFIALVFLAGLLYYLIRRIKFKGISSVIAAVILAGIYAYAFMILDVAIERVHYIQYGILGFLFYRTFRCWEDGIIVYFYTAIAVFLAGMGDETIQWALPNRVGEYRDIVINGTAGVLSQMIIAFSVKPAGLYEKIRKTDLKRLSFLLAFVFIAVALFMTAAHEYGFTIEDPEWGAFKSSLTREQLEKARAEGVKALPAELRQAYLDEAAAHYHMVNFHYDHAFKIELSRLLLLLLKGVAVPDFGKMQEQYNAAYKEFNIAVKYYLPGVTAQNLAWRPYRLARIHIFKPENIRSVPLSIHKKHHITIFSLFEFWLAAVGGAALCLFAPALLNRFRG